MFLAIDVGNTNIKYVIYDGPKVLDTFRAVTDSTKSAEAIGTEMMALLADGGYEAADIDEAMISSVVPGINDALKVAVAKFIGVTPMIVGLNTKTGIVLVETSPYEVGYDRLVNGVAALEKFGGPVLVIDYGTATKYDLFTEKHEFISAVTAPGIKLAAKTLWKGTAQLPEVKIVNPGSAMCHTTIPSIQAGIFYSQLGATEYIIDKMIEEYGHGPMPVVATGGLAHVVQGETDKIQYWEPDLTTYGLWLVHEMNK